MALQSKGRKKRGRVRQAAAANEGIFSSLFPLGTFRPIIEQRRRPSPFSQNTPPISAAYFRSFSKTPFSTGRLRLPTVAACHHRHHLPVVYTGWRVLQVLQWRWTKTTTTTRKRPFRSYRKFSTVHTHHPMGSFARSLFLVVILVRMSATMRDPLPVGILFCRHVALCVCVSFSLYYSIGSRWGAAACLYTTNENGNGGCGGWILKY